MNYLQFIQSNSSRVEAIAQQLVETGLTIAGKPKQPTKVPKNQTVITNLKKASDEELAEIIDIMGWTEEFATSNSESVAKVQQSSIVDLSQEEMREHTWTDRKGVAKTAPIVMLECQGLGASGVTTIYSMKSGKSVICKSSKALQLFVKGAIKVGDLVAFNPETFTVASYAPGFYEAGINISANANAQKLYNARQQNKAQLKVRIADYIDAGMSKEQAIEACGEDVQKAVGEFKPVTVSFD